MGHLALWHLLCLILSGAAIIGYRLQLLAFKPFFAVLGLLLLGWLLLALLSLGKFATTAVKLGPGTAFASYWLPLLLALLILVFAGSVILQSRRVPPIHDISTDTANPPVFRQAPGLRKASDNSLDYQTTVSQRQQAAYPRIKPLLVTLDKQQVFTTAATVARQMNWQVHHKDQQAGVIEAMVTSKLFGFVDDVIIRVATEGEQVRVDVRSASRVGVSDLGANAKRIENYLMQLQLALVSDN